MTHVLAIAGRKGSGKSSAAAFLRRNAEELGIDDVGVYSLAQPLKALCIDLLGLTRQQCYGTEEQKNTPTAVRWEDFPVPFPANPPTGEGTWSRCKSGPMTAREVLQHVGTEIFRRMRPDCWIEKCLRTIEADGPALAVVDDARFPDEVAALRAKGRAVLLTRAAHSDGHASETSLPGPEAFDLVIDNARMTVDETHQALVAALRGWGWILKAS